MAPNSPTRPLPHQAATPTFFIDVQLKRKWLLNILNWDPFYCNHSLSCMWSTVAVLNCSRKAFSDHQSDDFEQIIRHFEKIVKHLSFSSLQTPQKLLRFYRTEDVFNFGLILLILNKIIHKGLTCPTHLSSANVWGPVSFAVSVSDGQTRVCLMILNKWSDILQNHQQCLVGRWLFVNAAELMQLLIHILTSNSPTVN